MTTDLGDYGRGGEQAYEPPVRPRVRLTRRHLVAVPLALLLVEGVVLGGRLAARHRTDADPVRVAAAFFAAVASDEAATAAALTRLPDGIDTRFTEADLSAQGGITRPTVTAATEHGDRAVVTVGYQVAGVPGGSDLVLTRTYDGLLHAPTWRIVGGLPVLHIRAAPFETRATVNRRPVALHHGSADVTVLPGIVQVDLPARPPAASQASTVAATAAGTVVRLPATLDAGYRQQLESVIATMVAPTYGFFRDAADGLQFEVGVGGDVTMVAFTGQLAFPPAVDAATGAVLEQPPDVPVTGTATYTGSGFRITELRTG